MFKSVRMENVQSPIIPVVGELIRANPGTISLGQGVVSYPPPGEAAEYIQRFLADAENHKYHAVDGVSPLIEKIRQKIESENGIVARASDAETDGYRICVTAGANMAFTNAILAVCDPGDEVILLKPWYFNHEMAVRMANCLPVAVDTDADYLPVVKKIRQAISDKTRAVVTISPNNPTGVVYSEEILRQINRLCAESGIYHISDEAYEYFTYDDAEHFSPGRIPDADGHTISLFSLSKSYGFASWRIGYMVFPSPLTAAVKKIQDTILICPPVISQYAALGALQAGSDYCRTKLKEIHTARKIVRDQLAGIADICTISPARGAFYFLLKIATDSDDMALTRRLIAEHGVAVIPGRTFGLENGCYLRISYGPLKPKTAAEGIGRLVTGLKKIVRK